MKKIFILGLSIAVTALASFTASAGGADPYPAANFQPKVIYIDKESVKATPQCQPQKTAEKASEFDPKYPAANFTPKVIYP
ncbi:MAG: hypothetical protein QX198_14450 [Methylococcaceae bacterium]